MPLRIYNIIALVSALWFLLTSPMWTYLINVIIGFPFAALAFYFNQKAKKNQHEKINKATDLILITGVVVSIVSLMVLLIYN